MVFGKWLGRATGGGAGSPPRQLDSIDDLQIRDYLRLGLDSRAQLSAQEFTVRAVHGLDFRAGEADDRAVFTLESDGGQPVYLWRNAPFGEQELAFAYAAPESEVLESLDMEQFPALFETDRDFLLLLNTTAPDHPWLASEYREDCAQEAYFLHFDPRSAKAGATLGANQEAMDFYRLSSGDRLAAIEVMVFDGGRTDVLFINYLPRYKIEELLPSA